MHFESYLKEVGKKSREVASSIRFSVNSFAEKYIETFNYMEHVTGLMLGRVQSGKTGQILGVASKAADLGFKLFILLTTDNIVLQQQTIQRARQYLSTFNIYDETDYDRFLAERIGRPKLIVLKKNVNVLKNWHRHISLIPACRINPLIILDDEGDAASLNTKVNQRKTSPINSVLRSIRSIAPSSIYIQVTATPQALLLQTLDSDWRPSFIHIIKPGKGYLGGEFFYGADTNCQRLINPNERDMLLESDEIPKGLREAIISYLITSICRVYYEGHETNLMLVHPGYRVEDHIAAGEKIARFLTDIYEEDECSSFFRYTLQDIYNDFKQSVVATPNFSEVVSSFKKAVKDTEIIIMNSISVAKSNYGIGMKIIIGGNSLGRGITFPQLHTVYYCRSARIPQVDTMWQHSRVFGYDRDPSYCRLFIPPQLSNLFREFSEAEIALYSTIEEKGLSGISLLSPKGTRPTRREVININALNIITGGVNYFISSPLPTNTNELDTLLGMNDFERIISMDEALKILDLVDAEETDIEKLNSFKSCISALKNAGETECFLIVRTDRNISRGTGTLLSPNDRLLAEAVKDKAVLVMYRINGRREDGWNGYPIWVPNVKYPVGRCFYKTN